MKLAAASSIALGTFVGGWRIIRTIGQRLAGEIEPPQGFSAEASGASVLLASSYYGFPLSTTQIVTGAVMGSGVGKRLAAIRWGLAGRMVMAWLVTLPAAALVAAGAFEAADAIGSGAGSLVIGLVAAAAALALFFVTQRRDPVGAGSV